MFILQCYWQPFDFLQSFLLWEATDNFKLGLAIILYVFKTRKKGEKRRKLKCHGLAQYGLKNYQRCELLSDTKLDQNLPLQMQAYKIKHNITLKLWYGHVMFLGLEFVLLQILAVNFLYLHMNIGPKYHLSVSLIANRLYWHWPWKKRIGHA